ncbi:MAG: hypothetical protein GEV11_19525 [Streptosporangiales bacterium]|nr:hypothetical protein [Streptosporangiales bacterium]
MSFLSDILDQVKSLFGDATEAAGQAGDQAGEFVQQATGPMDMSAAEEAVAQSDAAAQAEEAVSAGAADVAGATDALSAAAEDPTGAAADAVQDQATPGATEK